MDLCSARLLLLVVAVTTITTCAAQEGRDDKVFANYDAMKRNGQAFLLSSQRSLYEKPEKKAIPVYILDWFSGFSFDLPADDTNSSDEFEFEGYVGRGVNYFLGNSLRDIQSSGADIPKINLDVEKPGLVLEISSSYVPALGAFEGRWLAVTDAWRCTFWDDGSNRSAFVKEEGHVRTHLTNAFVARGVMEWISVDRAAELLNVTIDQLTPEEHAKIYRTRWDQMHSGGKDSSDSSSAMTTAIPVSTMLVGVTSSTLLAMALFI